ncbi:MAG: M16 family metallopeptidase [Planctomycetota bacterium]|jgi:predicted Zn-dependent peptidase
MTIEFKHTALPNGLEVIAEVDPDAHTSAIGFFIKTGARDEDTALMGVSHFLEHMMFKGSEARSAASVDRDFDAIGADHNAYTTPELTAFWAHVLPEHLASAEEILDDILRPALRPADFDAEKSVILEEIAMYEDQPFWVLYERTMEAYYREHPLSHRVLGTRQTIESLTRDRMQAYFDHRYSADNTVVALAGRLDFDAMVQRLSTRCGGWQSRQPQRRYPAIEPVDSDFTLRSGKVTRHYTLMISPAPTLNDDRRYAAAMLAQILGDVDGSRLYWALIETGIVEEAEAHYGGRDGTGEYLVQLSCSPDTAEKAERIVLEEIDRLPASLTTDDLERMRSKTATGLTLAGERPAGRMQRLGQVWTYTGERRSLERELERINSITLDELRAVSGDFPLRPRVIGRLTPE